MPFSGLLPAIGSHPLAIADPSAAHALSDMLKDAVTPGTASTYASAFSQLVDFCTSRGMPFKAGQGVKAKSLSKYVCGVRHAHILHLGQWHLSNDSLVSLTLRAAGTRARPISSGSLPCPWTPFFVAAILCPGGRFWATCYMMISSGLQPQ